MLQCREHLHVINTSVLQSAMPPDSSDEFDLHLAQSVQQLSTLRSQLSHDVFVLVCNEDWSAAENEQDVHPKTVLKRIESFGFK